MSSIQDRALERNSFCASATAHKAKHYCRNPRCRSRLPEPVDNPRRAFCCRGCFDGFYRSRCRVCEAPIRQKNGQPKTCISRKCKADFRRFPLAYAWPEKQKTENADFIAFAWPPKQKTRNDPIRCRMGSRSAHSTGLKSDGRGDRPTAHCLRGWWWGRESDRDLSLYDANGSTIARIVLEGDGRYRLRTPIAIPRQTWAQLEEAKRGAESFALIATPLAVKLATRIKRDNEAPHPMGPPLNRPPLTGDAALSDWRPAGNSVGVPDIPDFLRRRAGI
jgi:hypothetical protein